MCWTLCPVVLQTRRSSVHTTWSLHPRDNNQCSSPTHPCFSGLTRSCRIRIMALLLLNTPDSLGLVQAPTLTKAIRRLRVRFNIRESYILRQCHSGPVSLVILQAGGRLLANSKCQSSQLRWLLPYPPSRTVCLFRAGPSRILGAL